MDLKKLILLKLICCGGPLLLLVVPWAMVGAATAALVDSTWYLAGLLLIVTGLLAWRARRWRQACDGQRCPVEST